MVALYKKSQIWFTMCLIAVYVIGTSVSDYISSALGIEKMVTCFFHIAMSFCIFLWLRKNGLLQNYGLCHLNIKASSYLYFVPLAVLSTVNIWFGFVVTTPLTESVFYIVSMLCVGFLEEVIFRGFLFRAILPTRSAIVVSGLTFGIGHIVNIFNGSGAGIIETLCQILYATAFGFLFVIIFYTGGSLLPCIISHSVINMLSLFSNNAAFTGKVNIILSIFICAFVFFYCAVFRKLLPQNLRKWW